ncbi:hypothetical protein LEMA_P020680.1 [Plenodomus lingam JN3]|uniref:Uncharacterized protein n=1 Tax=Leptosphaeria maculans (strain JN3 / isolate v23.1.3 / race Av1-4-5-6-7-8) TaxID=985895 RepID=E5AB97_LEPMJ|nr:hypothetical protein LEMA_P020680.1 [Plenodomus lingam JN3]CBY00938.1 hypothetical protein LEMA_P020680.1 [Plenodomus lingam JN3]
MDADRRLAKALESAADALQHLSISPDYGCLDCTHIDRLLSRVIDLPTEGNQRNSRRNLLVIRRWMVTEGPSVVLLEILGQLYWRLGELNSKQLERFKNSLRQQQSYLSMVHNTNATTLVLQRIKHIQKSKADACHDFLCELSGSTEARVEPHAVDAEELQTNSSSPFTSSSVRSGCSTSSQDSNPTGLIKSWPSGLHLHHPENLEQILIDFYVNAICPGRTVAAQSNVYVTLLQKLNTCLSIRFAILSLAAVYIRDFRPGEYDLYHQAELYYSSRAISALAAQIRTREDYEGALATSMLLMHQGALNQEDSPLCWSCHANIFDAIPSGLFDQHSDTAMFIRTQIILARSAQTSSQLQAASLHSFERSNWLVDVVPKESQRICGILGVSPELVFLISSINAIATSTSTPESFSRAQRIESKLKELEQWTLEHQGPREEILLATAECFRLATLLYLQCRIYGRVSQYCQVALRLISFRYTRFHPSILRLSDALQSLLLSLPVKGSLYTAIYPIWPLFIATVTTNSDRRDRLYQRVVPIREGDKGTLSPVLKRVSGLRVWLAKQEASCQMREDWWSELLHANSSTVVLGSNMLCLG